MFSRGERMPRKPVAIPDRPAPNGAMLTVAEVALLLRVHVNTVRRWSNQGGLKAYRIGSRGDRRFRREDVGSFLSRRSMDAK